MALLLLLHLILLPFVQIHSKNTPPPLPSASQLSWQQSQLALFLYLGTSTFTDRQWGTGAADPTVFNPTHLSALQWARTAKANALPLLILTAKHRDGFCLWPSNYTNYSVGSSTNWREGEERRGGRAGGGGGGGWGCTSRYGRTVEYNEFYVGQMTELLTKAHDSRNKIASLSTHGQPNVQGLKCRNRYWHQVLA